MDRPWKIEIDTKRPEEVDGNTWTISFHSDGVALGTYPCVNPAACGYFERFYQCELSTQ
jgi:hypothetical protein